MHMYVNMYMHSHAACSTCMYMYVLYEHADSMYDHIYMHVWHVLYACTCMCCMYEHVCMCSTYSLYIRTYVCNSLHVCIYTHGTTYV